MIPHFRQKPLAPSDRATAPGVKSTEHQRNLEWIRSLVAQGKTRQEIAEITGTTKSYVQRQVEKLIGAAVRRKVLTISPRSTSTPCTNRADCQCLKCRCEAGKTTEARLAMHREDELAKVDYFRAKQIGAR
jgi:hypothetical protein